MTASLATTSALLDLLPFGSRRPARTRTAEADVPLGHRLLPVAFRERLARRAARRALAESLARLQETSPHLLDDIGQPVSKWVRPDWNAPDHWLR